VAFIFPGIDDFGISAVEALAAGTPVIAYKDGGALDYIIEGRSGIFFEKQNPESLCKSMTAPELKKLSYEKVTEFSSPYSRTRFMANIHELLTGQ
jgi:glycosyltransferase involved in cell wall biosynthesis